MRNRFLLFLVFVGMATIQSKAQVVPVTTEQQLENLSETDESQLENDQYLQELRYFRLHPLNINAATADDWHQFRFVTDLQIQHFLRYRQAFGKFLNVYELQAVPSWDAITLRRILPYITVTNTPDAESLKRRLREGEHTLLARETRVLEDRKGYSSKITNGYRGSPDHVLLRYRYQYKNLLRYGVTADKDAGEAFGKGAQAKGFDFYSFHLFASNIGVVKSLVIGDYSVNMGQGLLQWQALSFKKSADAMAIKRQGAILQPYGSAGEYNFNRGVGATFKKKSFEVTLFGSLKRVSANLVADTIFNDDGVSSFLTSGFHRTPSEAADKSAIQQTSFGGNLTYSRNALRIGINGLAYQFSKGLKAKPEPYNKYEITGKQWSNLSLDYNYTFRNLHFFGEGAMDRRGSKAFINGLLLSANAKVDIALLYRNISPAYRALYGNAFTENTLPENEKGLYTGITIRPMPAWKLDAYADFYSFPWLKFRVDAPSRGQDYLVQATYQPNKQLELYTRFRIGKKAINHDRDSATNWVVVKPRQNWRLHFAYSINPVITVKARTEVVWYNKNGLDPETGFLTFIETGVKPFERISGNVRMQYFETEGFNSRIYAFESDVLYSYSIPAFANKGFRYYINLNYDVTRKLGACLRLAQVIYKDQTSIGSGLEEISGKKRTEVKLQVVYVF
ncbi:MAG: hypothetical protein JWP69_1502 [Flaviaesturariibacter sp.]|nr:hypothetical protein [Flaviaesturariibacter sp.]